MPRCLLGPGLLALALLGGGAASAQEAIPPEPPYREASEALERLIEHEREAKSLPAVSIALVADGRIVWSRGFGLADPRANVPATAETVYRVGSVSKLFTDLALMQLVEEGAVDLDAPVGRYLPDFAPKNPTATPITLRQMMAHRSGITREPPVGHYFDPTGPSLASTVESLNRTELVYPPGAKTKYSNAALAVVGQVVAAVRGEAFESAIKTAVLDPMGLTRSDFRLTPALAKGLAKARMWTYDGRTFEAPGFPLGTSPAGNLYSTVNDLGRFLAVLLDDGRGPGGRVVRPETLRAMRQVQFAGPEAAPGFGLGFAVSNFEGSPRIGHGGAVYGFATEVAALPYAGLGVAVVATRDCANGTVGRIADDALRALIATKLGKPIAKLATTEPIDRESGEEAEGSGLGLAFRRRALRRAPSPEKGGTWDEIRRIDGRPVFDGPFKVDLDSTVPLPKEKARPSPSPRPPDPPRAFDGLIGEYGWDHNVLYIYEKGGKLWALIEWFYDYPLEQVAPDRFRFGATGLYDGERADFSRDASGRAVEVKIGAVAFQRRSIAGEDGKTFRITPLRPVADLRAEALAARPPVEAREFRRPDLVDLTTLDPTIKLDVRYASEDNFVGTPFYSSAKAFLQRPAAEALARAHKALASDGLGLLIHDAYRPWHVTKMFWDATPRASRGFVADPAKGSRHNRGCAVDLTLYDLKTGDPIRAVGGYDEFSDRSNPDYPGGTSRQRWYRDRLRRAMEEQGFAVFDIEWWHFDYRDWTKYPILNATFEELAKNEGASPEEEKR